MKGQAMLEYLLIFGATLTLLSLLGASLAEQRAVLDGRADELEAAVKAESAARAIEAMLNGGGGMAFDFRREDVCYSVEQGRFHARAGDRLIEIEGVFHDDLSEPV